MKHIFQKSIFFVASIIMINITNPISFSVFASEELTVNKQTDIVKTSETVAFTIEKLSENQLKLVFSNNKGDFNFSKENFEIFGYYTDEYGEFEVSWEIKKLQQDSENAIILTGYNKVIKNFTYVVKYYRTEEKEHTKVIAKNSFFVSNEQKNTEKSTTLPIVLQNQEAIYIPANATFNDGTPIQNVRDIAKYAFSYMTSEGTPVVPTYEANETGIADIAKVTYRTNKGANAVIIQKVYLKVYLDPNQDNWVTAAEKAEDALGYYFIEVEVNKTLTVEDWTIVTE